MTTKHINTLKKYNISTSIKKDDFGNNIVSFNIPENKTGGFIGIDDALFAALTGIISAVAGWGTKKVIKAVEGEGVKKKKKRSKPQPIMIY